MVSILTSLAVALLASATPVVTQHDPTGCVDSVRLTEALNEALPEAWRGARKRLYLSTEIIAGSDGLPASLAVTLSQEGAAAPLMTRHQPIIEADCPSLPQLIAVIVGRHLAELPRDAWPEPPPPPPVAPEPGASAPVQPAAEVSPVTGHLELRLGLEVGLDGPLWGGSLAVDATVFGAQGYALLLGAEVLTYAPLAVGVGEARLTTVIGRLGPAWEVPLSDLVLGIALGLGAGATLAQGSGFDRDIAATGASLRVWTQASLRTRWGLSVTLGAALVALRPRLRATAMTEGVEAPAARLSASLGYVFGD
jgi:hypothetical protein